MIEKKAHRLERLEKPKVDLKAEFTKNDADDILLAQEANARAASYPITLLATLSARNCWACSGFAMN
ncbi:hypothetical protein QA645_32260 [Bradyrhizobium sp. CIAT3101]|uniref:hypothetical protein n=1 Tax=Bradyrhizobium sp. CIAT3101 TaxID=439387 RepID=UPI0024B200B9|nr:hypothetical protein [Bradyrhizobium sp. CIAT3101]WFU79171.1 hypothetical protein QA645_32260 [Bradyrhizobium sp. CIAT3101]